MKLTPMTPMMFSARFATAQGVIRPSRYHYHDGEEYVCTMVEIEMAMNTTTTTTRVKGSMTLDKIVPSPFGLLNLG